MTDFDLISDLHKDARGYRPSADWMRDFHSQPLCARERIWDNLIEELHESMDNERRARRAAARRFVTMIRELLAAGAPNRATAIRWLVESVIDRESLSFYGASQVCYEFDLDYRHMTFLAKVLNCPRG